MKFSISKAAVVASLMLSSLAVTAADGLIAVKSAHSASETATRLEAALKARKLTLFARIDHAAGAAKIGAILRPTEVFIFGNPQGGTPLMTCEQTVGIDLPLKALVWQDSGGQTWLGYNDPAWIGSRHQAATCPAIGNLAKALGGIAADVTAP